VNEIIPTKAMGASIAATPWTKKFGLAVSIYEMIGIAANELVLGTG
jgi:hypothetical protein